MLSMIREGSRPCSAAAIMNSPLAKENRIFIFGHFIFIQFSVYVDVMEDEISRLIRYRYSCNEQIASKLKALLAEQSIARFKGESQQL
jgi:hypothetical protein